jgi:hypothetical protein
LAEKMMYHLFLTPKRTPCLLLSMDVGWCAMEVGRVKDGPDRVDDAPKFGDVSTSPIVVEIESFCCNDVAIKQLEA